MELIVTQENFSRALNNVSRVASSKAGLPILNNILLRTDGTRLLVAATNLEIATAYHIGSKIASPGSITVPARLITDFVASLPKGQIDLKVSGNQLSLKSGTYQSSINGVVADEFPELPTIDESKAVAYQINPVDFKQAVSQTIITSSHDATRPVLTGVFWNTFEGSLYLAATDGYRLSERRLMESSSDVAAIIPTTTLQEVLRTLTDDVVEIDMLIDDTQVRFRLGDAEITSRLIDGNYPPYRELIPKDSETKATLPTSEFSRITKIAGLFARDSGGSVTVTVDGDAKQLTLNSIASELGENTSSTPATCEGSGSVTLNSRYISEALSVVDGDEVTFGFSGKLSPCLLRSTAENADYLHIIMPLKS